MRGTPSLPTPTYQPHRLPTSDLYDPQGEIQPWPLMIIIRQRLPHTLGGSTFADILAWRQPRCIELWGRHRGYAVTRNTCAIDYIYKVLQWWRFGRPTLLARRGGDCLYVKSRVLWGSRVFHNSRPCTSARHVQPVRKMKRELYGGNPAFTFFVQVATMLRTWLAAEQRGI